MRATRVIKIENGYEIIGIFVNEVLISTLRRRILGA